MTPPARAAPEVTRHADVVVLGAPAADETLVLRAREGDRWAQGVLFERHARVVANLAAHLLGSREDAADVVQDTFVTVLSELQALREPAAFRSWVLRVAVRHAHRRFRKRDLMRLFGLAEPTDPLTLATLAREEASTEHRLELAHIGRVLSETPLRARTAWLLHRLHGATLPETATALDCSLATVKRDLERVDRRVSHIREEVP